jgi:hypothetical protein
MKEYLLNTMIKFGGLVSKLQTLRSEGLISKLQTSRNALIIAVGFNPPYMVNPKTFWRYFCSETSKNSDKTKRAIALITHCFNPGSLNDLSIILVRKSGSCETHRATFLIHDPISLTSSGPKMVTKCSMQKIHYSN